MYMRNWKVVEGGKSVSIFLAMVMVVGMCMPITVQAERASAAHGERPVLTSSYSTVSGGDASGSGLGKDQKITWNYDADTKTLLVSGEDELKKVGDKSPFDAICSTYQVEKIQFRGCKLTGSASGLFRYMYQLKRIDLNGLNTENVTDMSYMFDGCGNLGGLDLSSFDTGNVTDMSYMFDGCGGLGNLDLSSFDTGNVRNMGCMFNDCWRLGSVDLSGLDAGNVTSMHSMFYGCINLIKVDMSNFNTRNVTNLDSMFCGCRRLGSVDLSSFDTGNVTNMQRMFDNCRGLESLDLSGFNTENTTDMFCMFYNCSFDMLKAPQRISREIDLRDLYWNEAGEERRKLTAEDAGHVLTKETTYRITYELNGGVNHSGNPAEGKNSSALVLQAPSRTGYTFAGWYRKMGGTDTKVTKIPAGNREDVILTAKWTVNMYCIVFNGNGAKSGSVPELTRREYDKSYTLPVNKFKRTGYTFTGWNTKKNGTGKTYKDKASVKNLTAENEATVTLYAQWKKNSVITYKIKFDGNGATDGKMSALTKCKSGKSYKLPVNRFKKKGYTFAGWSTKKNGKGKDYKNKASVKNLTTKNGATVTLYAQWEPITYTVKFDGNKASAGKMKDIKNCRYNKSFKLPKTVFKRKGYIFRGWNTRKDGKGRSYKNRAEVKNLTDKSGKTVVLYAQWKKAKK